MEGLITNAKNFLNSDEGKKLAQSAGFGGDESNPQGGLTDAFGNKGQEGQYGQQGQYGAVTGQGFGGGLAKDSDGQKLQGQEESNYGQQGQYGAVTGQGFGGGLAKGSDGQQLQAQPEGQDRNRSNYEGWSGEDSTTSGGWGGDAFSRKAQMGADNEGKEPIAEDEGEGYKTGASTPGYRHPDDVDALAAENRARNQDMRNLNTYGQQSDDSGAKGNDYHEQN